MQELVEQELLADLTVSPVNIREQLQKVEIVHRLATDPVISIATRKCRISFDPFKRKWPCLRFAPGRSDLVYYFPFLLLRGINDGQDYENCDNGTSDEIEHIKRLGTVNTKYTINGRQ